MRHVEGRVEFKKDPATDAGRANEEMMMIDCQYDLPELPTDRLVLLDEIAGDNPDVVKWSGGYPIPQIGDTVTVKVNSLGTGRVESYFVEHGYLGLTVRLSQPPEWKKQTPHPEIAMPFGSEIAR